jgi:PiT family inorganic phosphate transporter
MGVIALALFAAQADGTLDTLPSWLAFLHPDGGKDDIDSWIVRYLRAGDGGRHRAGGWRIIKTLGHKMVQAAPDQRLRRGDRSATILVTRRSFGMPVSTTHSISTAIMGVGFAKNPTALRWSVIERIVWAWILTIPRRAASRGCSCGS